MRFPVRTFILIAALVAAALAFHLGSGRVVGWLKAMHGGFGQTVHGKR